MATTAEIAERVLRKVKAIGANETASAEDLALGMQAVRDAHGLLDSQGLLRWTLSDVPSQVELAYVLMGAYLVADDFSGKRMPEWMAQGLALVQAFVHLPADCVTYASEY